MDPLETDVHKDDLQKRRQDQADITKKEKDLARLSCSSFPRASMRHAGHWTAQQNKVLCMNHHINIALRVGLLSLAFPSKPKPSRSDDELLSDDGGGPDANHVLLLDKPNLLAPKNAIATFEAFVTAVHRGSQRRADFRKRMEKEFYQNSQLAQAPFPSKPNTTRWNLHFSMIRMALAIREAIDAHYRAFIGSVGSRRLKFGENLLTPVQLRQLEVLQPILKLAAAATKDMEQASGTLCMVLDYHAILRDEIERLIGESQNSEDLDSESKEEIKKFLEAVEAKLGTQ
ncbi:unnamed protein product [Tilletia controversa]|nr:unnamed protein product [Tilletia controversa]